MLRLLNASSIYSTNGRKLSEIETKKYHFRWTLYELKENVVTINSEQCQHLSQLQKCIDVSWLNDMLIDQRIWQAMTDIHLAHIHFPHKSKLT